MIRFADEAHWRACFLVGSVRHCGRCLVLCPRGGRWTLALFQAGNVSHDTTRSQALLAQNVLMRLAAAEQLRPILADAAIFDLRAVAQTLGIDDSPRSLAADNSIDSLALSAGLRRPLRKR